MDFQESFQATATDHFFNYYKNETYFENKCTIRVFQLVFANITINGLQGAIYGNLMANAVILAHDET